MVYLRTKKAKDHLVVKWGDDSAEQCAISYDVTAELAKDQQNLIMTEAVCK